MENPKIYTIDEIGRVLLPKEVRDGAGGLKASDAFSVTISDDKKSIALSKNQGENDTTNVVVDNLFRIKLNQYVLNEMRWKASDKLIVSCRETNCNFLIILSQHVA